MAPGCKVIPGSHCPFLRAGSLQGRSVQCCRWQQERNPMNIRGGRTFYGQDIGILMMDTKFPRIPGDPGNAATFDFPVCYKVVRDVFQGDKIPRDADEILLKAFCKAARELEKDGCRAITTCCGFLAGFQRELADAVDIPVFTTTLTLIPMIASMIGRKKQIGIFSERAQFMTDSLFEKSGWSSRDYNICVSDLPEQSEFNELIIYNHESGDPDKIRESIRQMTREHMEKYPDTGAIVLECQNFAPFGDVIAKESGVPVFGLNQLIEFIEASLNYRRYDV